MDVVIMQLENRITNQLTGTVVGGVSAPLDVKDGYPLGPEVIDARPPPEGNDVFVLYQDQSIRRGVVRPRRDQLLLKSPDLPVLPPSTPEIQYSTLFHTFN